MFPIPIRNLQEKYSDFIPPSISVSQFLQKTMLTIFESVFLYLVFFLVNLHKSDTGTQSKENATLTTVSNKRCSFSSVLRVFIINSQKLNSFFQFYWKTKKIHAIEIWLPWVARPFIMSNISKWFLDPLLC